MYKFQYKRSKSNSLIRLSVVSSILLLGFAHEAFAEQEKGKANTVSSDFGLPTHRRDGGSRDNRNNCIANPEDQNLMALIPDNTIGINSAINPRLFFYVPKINNQKPLEFVLRNEQDELMYEAFFTTKGDGIMSVEIPADISSSLLETEQNYHWYLSMICDHQQRSRDIVVEGWLRQESIDLATQKQIDVASSIEQAEVYHSQGFWYDALSVLAEDEDAIVEQPMIRQKWSQMLESVGLGELGSEPFVETELIESSATSL